MNGRTPRTIPLDKRLKAFALQTLEILETSDDPAEEISEVARALALGRLYRGKFRRSKDTKQTTPHDE